MYVVEPIREWESVHTFWVYILFLTLSLCYVCIPNGTQFNLQGLGAKCPG